MYMQPGLSPWARPDGLVSVPIYFEDDVYFSYENPSFDYNWWPVPMWSDLQVFSFHPIHVFMNTCSPEHYQSFKGKSYDELLGLERNQLGIETILDQVLRITQDILTVGEAVDDYLGCL